MFTVPQATPITEPHLGRSVSLEQAGHLLKVSRRTVYNRIREGRLQTIRTLGGSQRVLVESLYSLGFSSQWKASRRFPPPRRPQRLPSGGPTASPLPVIEGSPRRCPSSC